MDNFHIAVPTVFNADLSLDITTTIKHIQRLYQQGIRAVMLSGTTGEQHSLLHEEKLSLLRGIEQADLAEDLKVIFAVSHPFIHKAIELAQQIEKSKKVSAILLAAPPYIIPTQEEFVRYVQSILAVTKKDIILYNNPARIGFDITLESLLKLSQNPQIIGIKDPTDVFQLKSKLDRDWLIFAGGEERLPEKIKEGYNACSAMVANIRPKEIHSWFECLLSDYQAVLDINTQMLLDEIFQGVALINIKNSLYQKYAGNFKYHRRP